MSSRTWLNQSSRIPDMRVATVLCGLLVDMSSPPVGGGAHPLAPFTHAPFTHAARTARVLALARGWPLPTAGGLIVASARIDPGGATVGGDLLFPEGRVGLEIVH